jgi:hypothetical protein
MSRTSFSFPLCNLFILSNTKAATPNSSSNQKLKGNKRFNSDLRKIAIRRRHFATSKK